MKRNHVISVRYWAFVSLIFYFGGMPVAASTEVKQEPAQSSIPSLNVDVGKCRLSGYSVLFDVMEGSKRVGQANRTLSSADGAASLSSHLEASIAFLSFTQSEQSILGHYQSLGFVSDKYIKKRKRPLSKTKITRFTVTQNSLHGDEPTGALFDPLSVYDHLRELVCSGLQNNVSLNIQEEKKIETYHFTYKGIKQLRQANRLIDTILMVRTRPSSSRETFVWFDANSHFLPVKIKQEKNGDTQAVLVANSIEVTK